MASFNHKVTFLKPGEVTEGQYAYKKEGTPTRIIVDSSWKEQDSTPVLSDGILVDETRVVIETWFKPEFDNITSKWKVISETGQEYQVLKFARLGRRHKIRLTLKILEATK